jgi:cobalt-zinc-cadmium efflux system membrane fusion protein
MICLDDIRTLARRNLFAATGLLLALGGGATTLALLSGCEHAAEGNAPTSPPGEAWLTSAQVKEGKIAVEPAQEHEVGGTITASGRITFDDLMVTHVFSPVSGRVVRVEAGLGARVKKGDPLAVIDSPDLGSTYSDLLKAQADLVAAEHEYKRKKELYEIHAASLADLEAAEDNYRKAKAELERARLKAQMLKMSKSEVEASGGEAYTLRSPIEGRVIMRALNPGLQVAGVLGGGNPTEFFTIGELKRVWVMGDVYEMDLADVQKGAKVQVSVITYPKKVFEGTVDWVASTLDPQLRTAKVRCVIDNPDELLKPEMYATVKISVPRQKALAVPKEAVLHLGDQTVVFVQLPDGPNGQKRFERRPVKLADDGSGDYLPVEHGLNPGEAVVVSGAILISGLI